MKTVSFDQLQELRTKASAVSADVLCDGWWLRYSKRGKSTVLTATLWPPGRGSVEEDWVKLGRITATMGVPAGLREVGNTIKTKPNAPHTWSWLS